MSTLKDQAEAMVVCLHQGIAAVSDVVNWADGWVQATSVPEGAVCELSIAAHRPQKVVIELLHAVQGTVNPRVVQALVFRWLVNLRASQRIDDDEAARTLCRMGVHAVHDAGRRWSGCFWDELESPELFGKTRERVLDEMQEVLAVLSAGCEWECGPHDASHRLWYRPRRFRIGWRSRTPWQASVIMRAC